MDRVNGAIAFEIFLDKPFLYSSQHSAARKLDAAAKPYQKVYNLQPDLTIKHFGV
jgi:hypothetical protein